MQLQGYMLNFSKTFFFIYWTLISFLCFHGTTELRPVLLFHKTVKIIFTLWQYS
jgi:hypothetical protein